MEVRDQIFTKLLTLDADSIRKDNLSNIQLGDSKGVLLSDETHRAALLLIPKSIIPNSSPLIRERSAKFGKKKQRNCFNARIDLLECRETFNDSMLSFPSCWTT